LFLSYQPFRRLFTVSQSMFEKNASIYFGGLAGAYI